MELMRHEVGKTILSGLPVCNHPKWAEFYQRRVDAYNDIADKCKETGIAIEMLRELVASVEDLERLSFLYVLERNHMGISMEGEATSFNYERGFSDGIKFMVAALAVQ